MKPPREQMGVVFMQTYYALGSHGLRDIFVFDARVMRRLSNRRALLGQKISTASATTRKREKRGRRRCFSGVTTARRTELNIRNVLYPR